MTTTSSARRTNAGTTHPEPYNALHALAAQADKAAQDEGLSPLLIELIKIRVSQVNGCAFCLRMHTNDSLAKGESIERLAVLPAWRESKYFDDQEQSALALAEYITAIGDSHANTGLYESAVESLTPGQVSAVTWLAVTINSYNRVAISSAYTVAPKKAAA
jgi:AhpD family alkylhydroperoxidase